jgi:hypothetical protein
MIIRRNNYNFFKFNSNIIANMKMKKRIYAIVGGLLTLTIGTECANASHCLSINRSGNNTYWHNSCGYTVAVSWTDAGSCSGWSCSDTVGGHRDSTASMTGTVRWCEQEGDDPPGRC